MAPIDVAYWSFMWMIVSAISAVIGSFGLVFVYCEPLRATTADKYLSYFLLIAGTIGFIAYIAWRCMR